LTAALVVVLAVTGLAAGEKMNVVHRWTGHIFVIEVYLAALFAIGVVLGRDFRRRPAAAIAAVLFLLSVLGFGLLNAFTGYLKPSENELHQPWYEETLNRFFVLHMIALPTLLVVFAIAWWWLFRPRTDERDY
jgi:hypothetical protein